MLQNIFLKILLCNAFVDELGILGFGLSDIMNIYLECNHVDCWGRKLPFCREAPGTDTERKASRSIFKNRIMIIFIYPALFWRKLAFGVEEDLCL